MKHLPIRKRPAPLGRKQALDDLRAFLVAALPASGGRRVFSVAVSCALAIGLLLLAFQEIDLARTLQSFGRVKVVYLFPSVGFGLLSLVTRSFLWKELFRPTTRVAPGVLFSSIVIGRMGNSLLPFRMGELLRLYSITRKENLSTSLCLSTIVVERTFDLLTLALLTGALTFLAPVPQSVRGGLFLVGGGSLALLGLLSWLGRAPPLAEELTRWVRRFLPDSLADRLRGSVGQLGLGLRSLTSVRATALVLCLSLACWGLMAVSYGFALRAYDLQFTWHLPLLLLVLLNVGMLLPTMPAALGVYQFFTIMALTAFGVDRSIGLGFSFLVQAVDLVPATLLGLWYLFE
ncbi:MAG: flippase-like domain-containing protein [Gemmatimonadetes bacterium]|nr:flippase-like domain-containing protein [Gemmatimonadota bacterium]